MKDFDFLEPAQVELEEEVKYYNEQRVGLGYEFATEVAATISRILRYLKPGPSFPRELAGAEPKDFHTESFTRSEATGS
jgi:hypothetical protein